MCTYRECALLTCIKYDHTGNVVPNQKLVLSGPRSRQRYQVRRGNLPADYGGRPAIGRLLLVS